MDRLYGASQRMTTKGSRIVKRLLGGGVISIMKPTARRRSNICCGADCTVQACNLQIGPGTAARFHGNLSFPLLSWPLVVWRRASFVLAPFHCGRGDERGNIPPTNAVTCGPRNHVGGWSEGPIYKYRVHTCACGRPTAIK